MGGSLTRHEERVNAATHAVGLAWAAAGALVLLTAAVRDGGPWQVLGCAFYAVTLLAAYAASTMSHLVSDPRRQRAWRAADQALIFLFIAGSYTPVALTWLRDGPWWLLHALVWGVALIGFVGKAVYAHRVELGTVSSALYVLLGWMPVAAAVPMMAVAPGRLLLWFLAGGVCYTLGAAVFFRLDHRVPFFHAAWHVLVMAGSACQYFGILFYCAAAAE